jgi:syndecan 1/integrin beta 8/collagen type III alpha
MGKDKDKHKDAGPSPKRGAFPTPKNVLSDAKPYHPEEAAPPRPATDRPGSGWSTQEATRRSGMTAGETIMSDHAGSSTSGPDAASTMGTPGTPPPPSSAGTGRQAGSGDSQAGAGGMGTPGTPPPPSAGGKTAGTSSSVSTKGTPGTPPPPSAEGLRAGAGSTQPGTGNMGAAGTPPRPAVSSTADASSASGGKGTAGTPPPPSRR